MSFPWLQNLGWAASAPVARRGVRIIGMRVLPAGSTDLQLTAAAATLLQIAPAGSAAHSVLPAGDAHVTVKRGGIVDNMKITLED